MSDPHRGPSAAGEPREAGEDTSFAEILSDFEQQQSGGATPQSILGTVISIGADSMLIDVGRKIEGVLSLAGWRHASDQEPVVGATIPVTIGPRNEEGFYELSATKVERPRDWSGLELAFAEKRNVAGRVVEQVKGGFRVDIGIRAFMPASRSGAREAEEMQALVGQEILCRITKLDRDDEDVVVDRRVVLEEEQARRRESAFANLAEGQIVQGRVRSLTDFGAFVDLGGVDGLLHIADMSWSRATKPADIVHVGDELAVKVLRIHAETKKISLGLKQLQEDPWTVAARSLQVGDRVSGTVSRLTDFGAFVELLPGVDGLIHLSELSWDKRVRKPGDLLHPGDRVEVVVLQVNPADKRIGLGLKQALGDPWEKVPERFPQGSTVSATVSNLTNFGAFVDLGDGIEGMIHISDITNEKRLDHPREVLQKGQTVRAAVLEIDRERRRLRLSMRQLEPTTVDHFIAEHKPGETVSGRLVEVRGNRAKVELGEGVFATCSISEAAPQRPAQTQTADVATLGAMLASKWKQGVGGGEREKETARAGQVRSFRIASLDAGKRLIELELAS